MRGDGEPTKSYGRLLLEDHKVYTVVRLLAAGLLAGESLLYARLLEPEEYGYLAFSLQLIQLVSLSGIGAAAGYMVYFFRDETSEQDGLKEIERGFPALAGGQMLIGAALATVIFVVVLPRFLASVGLFLLMLPGFIYEAPLNARRLYSISSTHRGGASLFGIATAAGLMLFSAFPARGTQALLVVSGAYLAFYLLYGASIRRVAQLERPRWSIVFSGASWSDYYRAILRTGVPIQLAGALRTLFLFAERFVVLKAFSGATLGHYSLARMGATGIALVLTSFNNVANVEIGSCFGDRRPALPTCWRWLRRNVVAGLGLFPCLAGAMWIITLIMPGYRPALGLSLLIAFGEIGYQVLAAPVPSLGYLRMTNMLVMVPGVLLLTAMVLLPASIAWVNSPLLVVGTTAALQICGGLVLSAYALERVKRRDQTQAQQAAPCQ